MAAAQAADFHAPQLRQRQVGNVDVEQPGLAAGALAHPPGGHAQHDVTRLQRGVFKVRPALLHLRKGNGRNAKEIAFHRRSHRAGIQRVVAHVRAVVHAGKHPVGLEIGQDMQPRVDAVGRRAVHKIKAVFRLPHAQRLVQGERITRAAAVAFGGDHAHVGKFAGQPRQQCNAPCQIAVVVGNQDIHVQAAFFVCVKARYYNGLNGAWTASASCRLLFLPHRRCFVAVGMALRRHTRA